LNQSILRMKTNCTYDCFPESLLHKSMTKKKWLQTFFGIIDCVLQIDSSKSLVIPVHQLLVYNQATLSISFY